MKLNKLILSITAYKKQIFIVFIFVTIFCFGMLVGFVGHRYYFFNVKNHSQKINNNTVVKLKSYQIKYPVHIPILMYHYVEYVTDTKDTIRKSLDILPTTLDKQIEILKKAGYTFITAGQLGDALSGRFQIPSKSIILTFDDGYRDLYTDVFPIIKKYHIKITAYIISGFLNNPNYLFSTQLKELVDSGLVEIGDHTINHLALKGKSMDVVTHEIKQSKLDLEKEYKISVVSFAYPYGLYDDQAMHIVKDAGFSNAVATTPGNEIVSQDQIYDIHRVRPGSKTGEDLISYIEENYNQK
jgi:peptidoglycan/xylan/chitin deacetylase (PgdA/CDA1 family)